MIRFESRPCGDKADLPLLVDFARGACAARWPRLSYVHPGDVAWRFYTPNFDPAEIIQLWFDDRGLAGYAWLEPPLNVEFDVREGHESFAELFDTMLAWAEDCRRAFARPAEADIPKAYAMLGDDALTTVALDSDATRVDALARHGYEKAGRHGVRYRRSLAAPIPEVDLPPGMRVRHVLESDLDERIDLHRDAWSVWGPSSQDVPTYRRLRSAPVYDPELDIVVEDAEGRLVSYCICWADAELGVGTFEPVGTRPAFIGRGLARAAIFEALRRLRARGLHTALVGTASVNERAMALYPSCGFEEVDREQAYSKVVV